MANPSGQRLPSTSTRLGTMSRLLHSLPHPAQGSLEDVVPVDDLRPHKNDAVSQSLPARSPQKEPPVFLGQLFGVVDPPHRVLRVQDAGGHADRPAQRAPARLVHTCKAALFGPHCAVVLIQRTGYFLVCAALHPWSSPSAGSSRRGGRSSVIRPHLQAPELIHQHDGAPLGIHLAAPHQQAAPAADGGQQVVGGQARASWSSL